MKRYLSEKALMNVVRSYDNCVNHERLADSEFSREYWKGKTFGIIEAFCLMTAQSWPAAEHMLRVRRTAMLREQAAEGTK